MKRPWGCFRCKKINAPHMDQCYCTELDALPKTLPPTMHPYPTDIFVTSNGWVLKAE